MSVRAVLWRRLDVPGHDACRFRDEGAGLLVQGTAVFVEGGEVTRLSYEVTCAPDGSTRRASVAGWIGRRDLTLVLERNAAGAWMRDGAPLAEAAGLLDLDLGFTPATNTTLLRRLQLRPGQEVEVTVLWLDPADASLRPLPQVLRVRSPLALDYASPDHGYRAVLATDAWGIVREYPGLWEAVS